MGSCGNDASIWRGSAKEGRRKPCKHRFPRCLDYGSARECGPLTVFFLGSFHMLQILPTSIQTECEDHTFQRHHFGKEEGAWHTHRYRVVWKEKQDVTARVKSIWDPLFLVRVPIKHLLRQEPILVMIVSSVGTLFCCYNTCCHVLLSNLWCLLDNNDGNNWFLK